MDSVPSHGPNILPSSVHTLETEQEILVCYFGIVETLPYGEQTMMLYPSAELNRRAYLNLFQRAAVEHMPKKILQMLFKLVRILINISSRRSNRKKQPARLIAFHVLKKNIRKHMKQRELIFDPAMEYNRLYWFQQSRISTLAKLKRFHKQSPDQLINNKIEQVTCILNEVQKELQFIEGLAMFHSPHHHPHHHHAFYLPAPPPPPIQSSFLLPKGLAFIPTWCTQASPVNQFSCAANLHYQLSDFSQFNFTTFSNSPT